MNDKKFRWGIEEVLPDNPIRHRIVTVMSLDILCSLVSYLMHPQSERGNEIVIVKEEYYE